ncbi:MAG: helical backbone metal receptor [Candidatus Wallbacteria bacterium]
MTISSYLPELILKPLKPNNFVLILIGFFILSAGVFSNANAQAAGTFENNLQPATSTQQVEFTDANGKILKFETSPRKIISTSPAITEIISYIGCADRLCGVTTLCDYPEEVKKIEKIGDVNLNYEKILQMKPDLIFVMKGLRNKESEILESFGIKSFSVELNSIDSILNSIELISQILRAPRGKSELCASYKTLKNEIKKRQKSSIRSIYFEIWGDPPMSVGKASFMSEIIKAAHGINIFADSEFENVSISLEKVIEKNPEFIILAYPCKTSEIALRNGFGGLIAVKDSNVIAVDYNMYVRPGPRIFEAILDLYNKLYSENPILPETIFKSKK